MEAYGHLGDKVWTCELEAYGKVKKHTGDECFIPFRFQGQYHDSETGLYYNRFRYYAPEEGMYVSQDPIRLSSGSLFYKYVSDPYVYLDIYGLMELFHGTTLENADKIKQNGVDLSKNRPNLDFNNQNSGAFYTSDSLKDTQKYNNRLPGDTDIVKFDIPDEELSDLKIKTFDTPDEEWADFVTKARKGELVHDYDIVIGPKLANPEEVLAGGTPKAIKKQNNML